MQYRLDKLQFSSLLPQFINIGRPTNSLAVSGTIANGSGQNFTDTITLASNTTFSDIKVTNTNTGKSTYIISPASMTNIWQYASTEAVQCSLVFFNGTVTFAISVSNYTGATITLVNQPFQVEVIEYDIPF